VSSRKIKIKFKKMFGQQTKTVNQLQQHVKQQQQHKQQQQQHEQQQQQHEELLQQHGHQIQQVEQQQQCHEQMLKQHEEQLQQQHGQQLKQQIELINQHEQQQQHYFQLQRTAAGELQACLLDIQSFKSQQHKHHELLQQSVTDDHSELVKCKQQLQDLKKQQVSHYMHFEEMLLAFSAEMRSAHSATIAGVNAAATTAGVNAAAINANTSATNKSNAILTKTDPVSSAVTAPKTITTNASSSVAVVTGIDSSRNNSNPTRIPVVESVPRVVIDSSPRAAAGNAVDKGTKQVLDRQKYV
jgi:hypothetical protein